MAKMKINFLVSDGILVTMSQSSYDKVQYTQHMSILALSVCTRIEYYSNQGWRVCAGGSGFKFP
eukprot:13149521-Ditylum_brightwellii.AAC.1